MRKHAPILSTLILTFALCTIVTAQTSANSTQANQSPGASEARQETVELKSDVKQIRLDLAERQIRKLLDEIKSARTAVTEQKKLIASLDEQLTVEIQNSASLERSRASAEREINSLNAAIAAKTELVDVLTAQRDKERKKVKKARRQQAGIAAGAVIGAAAGGPLGAAIGAAAGWLVGIF